MRRTALYVASPKHIPLWERIEIEALIDTAERAQHGGRLAINHDALVIEAHGEGFFVATAIVGTGERPDSVSPTLWSLLEVAFRNDAPWILFDAAEAPHANLPVF